MPRVLCFFFGLWVGAFVARSAEPTLATAFAHPPDEARPWVYWFLCDGNVTRAGITADLEAMQRVGLGGVLIMNVDQNVPGGPVRFMSPAWRELLAFAVAEAGRLGLKVNLNNDDGWTGSGGPWIDPAHSMQKVVWTETVVSGGLHFNGVVPQPESVANYYRDIALLAIPTPPPGVTAPLARERIPDFAAKSGLKLASSAQEGPSGAVAAGIDPANVIDLTAELHDGHLTWNVPPGNWTLLRLGHTSTGKTNYPATTEGKGLEVDKLSRSAVDLHFDAFAAKVIEDAGGNRSANTLTTIHVDSWEVGYQNWTPEFRAAFRRLRGYDLQRWLPAFTGRVMGNAGLSERFLWDVRRTIAELLNQNYATRLAERAHEHHRLWSVQGYRYGPFDCLSYAGRADLPIGEFWTTHNPLSLHPSVKTMTSAGHIYGRNVIAAEAFTATDALGRQRNHPFSLKAIGDAAFCAGINQFIIHRYAMQPWGDDRRPGMTMGPWGVEYERTATWWAQTKPWHEYLARCQYLLQQGRFVADLCYLQSEEGFNNPALLAEIKPAVPAGFDFDFCSDEIVRSQMTVVNGRILLPSGMTYRVLVLPAQRLMTPELLRKIRDLVHAGATVYGPPPLHSPSLTDYPACDEEVKRLVAELWLDRGRSTVNVAGRAVGQGKVIWGVPLEAVLAELNAEPDFVYRKSGSSTPVAMNEAPRIRYVHRTLADREIYFVANPEDTPAHVVASFRAIGGIPELWNAETGDTQRAVVFDADANRLRLPLDLAPRGSVFVVIPKGAMSAEHIITVKKEGEPLWETAAVSLEPRPASPPAPAIVENFTMAAWVKPSANTELPVESAAGTAAYTLRRNDVLFPPPAHEVFGQRDAAGAGFAVGRNGVCVLEHGDHHFPATLVYQTEIHDWTHVAIVFERGVPALYLNGQRVRTGLKSTMNVHGGVGVAHDREVEPFRGERSALRQFDRVLPAEEIAELMRTTPKIPVQTPAAAEAPLEARQAEMAALQMRTSDDAALVTWATQPGRYEMTNAAGERIAANVTAVPAPLVIDGEWTLRFPAGSGAPSEVKIPALISWPEHSAAGVRYFSGTATYTKTFDLPHGLLRPQRRVWLDLGGVAVIAEVQLNGRKLGELWKPPFRIDVTDALQRGANQLEIKVTNLWINRLIGDEQLPADREWTKVPGRRGFALKAYPEWLQRGEASPAGRVTFATWKHYEKDAELVPSGLLGPVTLRFAEKVEWEKKP